MFRRNCRLHLLPWRWRRQSHT